jgi:Toastrack DUF4097
MADQCRNCGAELFYGQRFCRACGKTTDPIVAENAPTQRMPPPPDMWGSRQANTAPTTGQDTSPVFAPPSYYQPQPPPIQPYMPPQQRSNWPWIVAIIGSGLLVAMILGVILVSRSFQRGRERGERAAAAEQDRKAKGAGGLGGIPAPPEPPDMPELPAPPPLPPGAESVLGADNAQLDLSGSDTIITKTFKLDKTATVTLANTNGDITIESSERPEAELTVTKRGGSEQDREAMRVRFFSDNGRLSLRTEIPSNSRNLSVHYELKLPRKLGRVDIKLTNGDIKMSDIEAQIAVSTMNGQIELSDVTGVVSAKAINGNIEAQLTKLASDRPMEFKSVNGNIEIRFNSDVKANLTASTTTGSIELDDDFGITVQKPMIGQRASGPIGGGGGPTLSVKTVSGNIKITK